MEDHKHTAVMSIVSELYSFSNLVKKPRMKENGKRENAEIQTEWLIQIPPSVWIPLSKTRPLSDEGSVSYF